MINLWYVYDKFMKVYDESMIHLWNIYDTSRINLRYLSENIWTTLINHDKSMIHLGYIYDTSVFCVRNIWYIYWYIYDTSIIHLWYIYHKSMINLDTLDCLGFFLWIFESWRFLANAPQPLFQLTTQQPLFRWTDCDRSGMSNCWSQVLPARIRFARGRSSGSWQTGSMGYYGSQET